MYVTPDISGVEINFPGAVAQPFRVRMETLGAAAQRRSRWRGVRLWRTKRVIFGVPIAYTVAPNESSLTLN